MVLVNESMELYFNHIKENTSLRNIKRQLKQNNYLVLNKFSLFIPDRVYTATLKQSAWRKKRNFTSLVLNVCFVLK